MIIPGPNLISTARKIIIGSELLNRPSAPILPADLAEMRRRNTYANPADPGNASDGYYHATTSEGIKRWPRVTEILDGMGGKHFLTRWIVQTEQGAFRSAAVDRLLSTTLGDGPMIPRAQAVERMQSLTPAMESEKIKQRAADYGTKVHSAVERFLKAGEVPAKESEDPDALALYLSFNAFRVWWESAGLTAVKLEQRVSCRACAVGGTLDILARDSEGRLLIVDLKTSKSIHDVEMSMQLSAYRHCAAFLEGEPIDYALIVRAPKGQKTERAKAEVRRYEKAELDAAFAAFQSARHLWRFQREVEGKDYGDEPMGSH